MNEWLGVPQVADELAVSRQTVRNWIRKHRLHAVQAVERGEFRVHRVELDLFKQRIGLSSQPPRGPLPPTRDLSDPEDFYAVRIQPVLDALGESSGDAVLRRLAANLDLAMDFYKFPSDYASYVARVADTIGEGHARAKAG